MREGMRRTNCAVSV